MSELPVGWASVCLDDVYQLVRGITFPTADKHHEFVAGTVACLRTTNVQKTTEWSDLWFVPEEHVKHQEQYVQEADVLISTANSYELVGKVSWVGTPPIRATLGAFISLLRARQGVSPAFLFAQMSSEQVQQAIRAMASTTTNISNVSGGKLKELKLALAPIGEQARIVAKLEELLSDLDAGVAELKAAQAKLGQYRQSLLKAAVDGSLTAEWRRTHTASETGAQLLERILVERRQRWEAKQLAKFQEQGKSPPKGWENHYPHPVRPDTTGLPELPEGWVWASLDMLGDIASGVAKGMKKAVTRPEREVAYLRVANVQRGYLDLSEIKTIMASEADIEELRLQPGDVLFNEGGDIDKLGRGWVWKGEVEECIHQNHVFRFRPFVPELLPELISHHGNTFGQRWFKSAGKQTTNLASINMSILRTFPVPVAPHEEQRSINDLIGDLVRDVEVQSKTVLAGFNCAQAQRKNILKAAFSGQLVPQDPNDEPASVLLERIRAERAEQGAKGAKRGRKAKA